MTEAEQKHLDKVELALRVLWGATLALRLKMPEDRYVAATFEKVDRMCRATGLTAREGCVFIEEPPL